MTFMTTKSMMTSSPSPSRPVLPTHHKEVGKATSRSDLLRSATTLLASPLLGHRSLRSNISSSGAIVLGASANTPTTRSTTATLKATTSAKSIILLDKTRIPGDKDGAATSTAAVSSSSPSTLPILSPGEIIPKKPLDETERILTLQMVLKCSDLGHLAAPLALHQRWVANLEEEVFRQGDAEKELGLPISPLFDRSKQGISKSQVGFFDIVALPMFSSFTRVFPGVLPLLENLMDNYGHWKGLEPPVVAKPLPPPSPPPSLSPHPHQQLGSETTTTELIEKEKEGRGEGGGEEEKKVEGKSKEGEMVVIHVGDPKSLHLAPTSVSASTVASIPPFLPSLPPPPYSYSSATHGRRSSLPLHAYPFVSLANSMAMGSQEGEGLASSKTHSNMLSKDVKGVSGFVDPILPLSSPFVSSPPPHFLSYKLSSSSSTATTSAAPSAALVPSTPKMESTTTIRQIGRRIAKAVSFNQRSPSDRGTIFIGRVSGGGGQSEKETWNESERKRESEGGERNGEGGERGGDVISNASENNISHNLFLDTREADDLVAIKEGEEEEAVKQHIESQPKIASTSKEAAEASSATPITSLASIQISIVKEM
uniref:PDEase domain-containing protein n=1 Tax=Polytomella parva TaxID=51329 RepID=A0A7S0UT11_9CHLO